ncbi:MAG: tRNA (N(6)-L-threonylcarbamoyladenosine(37)-C(2))-methylthiotransferase MtaB, partial [Muribaculaceae bacterium]|nr:tRNA (N(6)-L-threonylcarbamoyladenosine(37)-C(2))-methylthiotransferase MtaB [Muribaculaceae bacterium]
MTDDSNILRASYHTLGCKLNFSETSAIGMQLAARGIIKALPDEVPDIVVVNTCSVTEVADKKGRSLIRRLRNRWPDATLVVTGCYAQLKPHEVAAIEGVDMVLGSDEKLRMADYLEEWERDRRARVE